MSDGASGTIDEFVYRLPGTPGGNRPGAHGSRSVGAGIAFERHLRLLDYPDPRRLDLRASLRDPNRDWLVRANRQRSSIVIRLLIDVSASMHFGSERRKLEVVAELAESVGHSAFRAGDAVSLLAFDTVMRGDLFLPGRCGRGVGPAMAARLRECRPRTGSATASSGPNGGAALSDCVAACAGRDGLVFVVSDFHWPLEHLAAAFDRLSPARVVPVVVWDPAELEPPAAGRWLATTDVESGRRRSLLLRSRTRQAWRDNVAARSTAIDALCRGHESAPFHVRSRFDATALSRYFMERVA